jgi:hypothetical protein
MEPAQTPYYLTQPWSGLDRFVCPACGFDTLLQPRIVAHEAECRVLAQARAAVAAPPSAAPDGATARGDASAPAAHRAARKAASPPAEEAS